MEIYCDKCGECCRHLPPNNSLNRGDGVCVYLKGNECGIYENRPIDCQMDKMYDLVFSKHLSESEYYYRHLCICIYLKSLQKKE